MSYQGLAAFTNSSSRNDLVDDELHWQNLDRPNISMAISVYSGELAAIDASIIHLHCLAQHVCLLPFTTVFTNFLSAIQTLQTPGQQSA